MTNQKSTITMDKKRKNTIRNICYALIVTFTIVISATIIAVSVNTSSGTKVNISSNDSLPVANKTVTYISPMDNATIMKDFSNKELQYNDTLKQWEIHKALDIMSDTSANVYAVTNGTVTNVYTNYLEGGVIEITHENGIKSVYKSLTDVSVKSGDYVKQGDLIGSASTNMNRELNSGAHLHFEMYDKNIAVNPNNYIDFSKK